MKDYLKEKISYYKLILTFAITGLYGLLGWFFGKIDDMDNILKSLTFLAFCIIISTICVSVRKIRFYTNNLKEENK